MQKANQNLPTACSQTEWRILALMILLTVGALLLPATFTRAAQPTPAAATRAVATTSSRPNVVMIISDDHAWTDYGFMQHPQLETPRLDRLARESLTFRRGYVPSSLCCPSLASIITGLYPHQHRITSNDPPIPPEFQRAAQTGKSGKAAQGAAGGFQQSAAFREGREIMNRNLESVATLPKMLAQAGYVSFQSGKWWQGAYQRGGFTHGMTKGQRHGDEGLEIGRKTMQPIFDFLDEAQRDQKPFFVWYAPMMPHDPHTPPERLLDKYRARTDSLHVARYWAMVEWFDETIGQLLDELDRRQLSENTLVVYVTDNGWIQDPKQPRYAAKSKQSPYDGGLRTPILLRWPGRIQAEFADDLAMSIDLVPTVLAATGLQSASTLPGIDLRDTERRQARRTIQGACFTHNAVDLQKPAANLRWRWTVDAWHKLIVPDPDNQPDDRVELYDLKNDPMETKNLADVEKDRVQSMQRALDAWWKP